PGFNREVWNASDLAERSRFNSPFLLEASRVMAFLNGTHTQGYHLAVADDDAFALGLFEVAVANGRSIAWLGAARPVLRMRGALASAVGAVRRMLGEARAAVRRRWVVACLRAESPLTPKQVRDVDVWIVVWATDKTFTPGAVLEREDRAGRLPGLLREGGLRVGYIALPLWPERYAEMAANALQCAEPVLTVEDGLTPGDLLRACGSALWPLPGVKRKLVRESF
ncbi:MAG: hypothetical protein NTZ72_17475, partial [Afipia sp.]|nr:hypothetical protein [Afipia sp.]